VYRGVATRSHAMNFWLGVLVGIVVGIALFGGMIAILT
jgi:hypothetical protein